jgi:molybdopterin molybdotransferase
MKPTPAPASLADIAAALAGYDPQALRADMVDRFLQALVKPVQAHQTLALKDALGRVLASDVVCPIDVPAHDNSAMDGYAFDGAALSLARGSKSLEFTIVGTALAGLAWKGVLHPGQCIKIMTGAVMPQGLNTVVPQEMVTVQGQTITLAAGSLKPGDNRRLQGEDLQKGKPALLAGEKITPAALGLLASLGISHAEVYRPLRVAYFSTGDEILSLGDAPREGAVYDSNRYTLFGLLTRLGVELIDMGIVKDDPFLLEAAFQSASEQADAIITSGGVSVGEADHTKAVMRKMAGGESGVAFWRIAMRPGRPMAVGRIGKSVLFGLPGNPVAVMVTFLAFVRPALLQMMGCKATQLPLLKALSSEAIRKKPGRTEYQRGIVTTSSDGRLQVRTTGQQGSGVLSSMAQANGLIVLHHDQGNVAVGDAVDVMMFDGAI